MTHANRARGLVFRDGTALAGVVLHCAILMHGLQALAGGVLSRRDWPSGRGLAFGDICSCGGYHIPSAYHSVAYRSVYSHYSNKRAAATPSHGSTSGAGLLGRVPSQKREKLLNVDQHLPAPPSTSPSESSDFSIQFSLARGKCPCRYR
jgi:hypothetical protein